ncbi:MAG: hypothetical protein J6X30_00980 [Clostridia bacterium]|nr:hypothetical protein [Clostridia bacterium]
MKRTLRGSKTAPVSTENLTDAQKKDVEMLKGMAKRYEGKSESELLRDLKSTVAKGKANGTLTDEKLRTLAQTVAPMLSGAQKDKLRDLMKQLGQ